MIYEIQETQHAYYILANKRRIARCGNGDDANKILVALRSLKVCGICGKPNSIGEMCEECGREYHAEEIETEFAPHSWRTL